MFFFQIYIYRKAWPFKLETVCTYVNICCGKFVGYSPFFGGVVSLHNNISSSHHSFWLWYPYQTVAIICKRHWKICICWRPSLEICLEKELLRNTKKVRQSGPCHSTSVREIASEIAKFSRKEKLVSWRLSIASYRENLITIHEISKMYFNIMGK